MTSIKIPIKQTKEERILEVASELFKRQGFEKTSIEEIARAVPMSKVTLYTLFLNKEDILLAICMQHCNRLDAKLIAKAEGANSRHLECLMEMLKVMVSSIYAEAASVQTAEAQMYISTRIRTLLVKQMDARRKIFQSVFDKAVKAKELPGGTDTKHLCEVVMTSMTSFLPPYNRHFSKLNAASQPPLKTLMLELDTLINLLLAGLKQYKTE
jgi:AcrR family transcriptional regulator